MHKESCVRTVHAEANAVGRAAKKGNALNGCTAYVTAHPCIECIKLLIAAGCQRVVYGEPYHEDKDEISSTIAHGLLKIEFLEIRGGVQCG
jgi:deoxycytidylate deaminase